MSFEPELWLLTVAPAERVTEVEELIKSLDVPKDRAIVVAHSPTFLRTDIATVIDYPDDEFNISKWWDFGLDYIKDQNQPGYPNDLGYNNYTWDVLVIESDVRMTRADVETLRSTMREHECVMAGADWQNCLSGPEEVKVRKDNSVWIAEGKEAWQSRLPGMALVVAGEAGVRHAPLYPKFWFSDDHYEWISRVNGGTVLVGGTTVHHTGTQGPLKGDMLRWAEEDSESFREYWGGHPGEGGST